MVWEGATGLRPAGLQGSFFPTVLLCFSRESQKEFRLSVREGSVLLKLLRAHRKESRGVWSMGERLNPFPWSLYHIDPESQTDRTGVSSLVGTP